MTHRIPGWKLRETTYWQNYYQHFVTRRFVWDFNKTLSEDLKKYNARLLTVASENSSAICLEFDSPEDWFEFRMIWS